MTKKNRKEKSILQPPPEGHANQPPDPVTEENPASKERSTPKSLAEKALSEFKENVREEIDIISHYRDEFIQMGVNPYRDSLRLILMKSNELDGLAGMKGKSTS